MNRPLNDTISAAFLSLFFLLSCGGQQSNAAMPAAATSTMPMASAAPSAPASAAPAGAAATDATAVPSDAQTSASTEAPLTIAIEPRSGSKLKGTASFESTSEGVKVTLDITDAPAGKHGAHIHQNADCSSKDGKSAGDHFNPEGHHHGLPMVAARHLGDLGNLEVGRDGKGHLEITVAGANLKPNDKLSFLDRGIIIHEKVDDGSQPAGNAGARIGCGEIKR